MLEKQVEAKVYRWAKKNGVKCYKLSGPNFRGKPDRIFMANGEVLFLEMKRPGAKPTKLQLQEIDDIRAHGVNADWADTPASAIDLIKEYLLIE
jgi:hypothetical protein